MSDIVPLFLRGVIDSLRFKQGIIDVVTSYELSKRTLQITVINGFIYLGSVYVYNYIFIKQIISNKSDAIEPIERNQIISWMMIIFGMVMKILYYAWIFMIYIMAMTLTTFWVQDIFDELVKIKLRRIV